MARSAAGVQSGVRLVIDGKVWKIVGRRRRFCFPLQSARLPRIISCSRSRTAAAKRIGDKDEPAQQNDEGADGRREIGIVPTEAGDIGVNAARHSNHAQPVHREKRQVEADEENPERQLAEPFVHQAAGELGKPVVKPAKKRKESAADENVMKLGVALALATAGGGASVHSRPPAPRIAPIAASSTPAGAARNLARWLRASAR